MNNNLKKRFINKITVCIVLFVLITTLSIILLKTDILKNSINKTTANYISMYNKTTTDILEIKNIEKMSDKKGKSNNKSSLDIKISGDKTTKYEIVIYPKVKDISNEYIKVYLKDKNELVFKRLSELEDSEDQGKIIYKGDTYNNNMILRLWIDNKYQGNINNNSFEIKIKPR